MKNGKFIKNIIYFENVLLNIDDKIVTLLYNNKPIALYRKENDIYRVYKMLEINTDDNWLS